MNDEHCKCNDTASNWSYYRSEFICVECDKIKTKSHEFNVNSYEKKCDCGGDKVYGKDANLHSFWCSSRR